MPPTSNGNSITVSAGDLLGRSHEELVLLLIQLRRESAALKHAAELCRADVLSQVLISLRRLSLLLLANPGAFLNPFLHHPGIWRVGGFFGVGRISLRSPMIFSDNS